MSAGPEDAPRRPWVARGVAALYVAASIATWPWLPIEPSGWLLPLGLPAAVCFHGLGGADAGAIARGEWTRLLAAPFIHAGVLHLGLNAASLVMLGPFAEPILGRRALLVVLALGGIASSAAATLGPGLASVGASGAVIAVCAAASARVLLAPAAFPPAFRRAVLAGAVVDAVVLAVLGALVPFVDNRSHAGGAAAGVALGAFLALSGRVRHAAPTRGIPLLWIPAAIALVAGAAVPVARAATGSYIAFRRIEPAPGVELEIWAGLRPLDDAWVRDAIPRFPPGARIRAYGLMTPAGPAACVTVAALPAASPADSLITLADEIRARARGRARSAARVELDTADTRFPRAVWRFVIARARGQGRGRALAAHLLVEGEEEVIWMRLDVPDGPVFRRIARGFERGLAVREIARHR